MRFEEMVVPIDTARWRALTNGAFLVDRKNIPGEAVKPAATMLKSGEALRCYDSWAKEFKGLWLVVATNDDQKTPNRTLGLIANNSWNGRELPKFGELLYVGAKQASHASGASAVYATMPLMIFALMVVSANYFPRPTGNESLIGLLIWVASILLAYWGVRTWRKAWFKKRLIKAFVFHASK